MRLLSKHRRHVRATARAAVIEAGGDKHSALRIGEQMLREEPGSIVGTLLINLAVALLVKLVEYFVDRYIINGGNVRSIPDDYQENEPGFNGWGIDDAD